MSAPDVLAALPSLERLPVLLRALAVLDVVLTDDEGSRYFTFDPRWHEGEVHGRMDNGSGDHWHCWVGPPGAAIVGFDHESVLSPYRGDGTKRPWPGLLDGVPDVLRAPVLEEPAFEIEATTVLVWRLRGEDAWRSGPVELPPGPDPDGARALLEPLLDDDPHVYVGFAVEYYEAAPGLHAVAAVYRGDPLTAALVAALNPERDPAAALAEAAGLGHPTAD